MHKNSKPVALWLFTCAFAVFLMALLGAVTRLTESGLSIVEWKPVTGALMPQGEAGWNREFSLYQASPQYKQMNAGMTLGEFKKIYFWEWLHRLWGRVIGLIYFAPLVWFWAKGYIPRESRKPLLGILGLGFLQGGLGWFMVKSGLVDVPAVSHYRLAAHLLLAFIIFCALFRMGLRFYLQPLLPKKSLHPLKNWVRITLAAAGITMLWGAFVAGLRAGKLYNDKFPFMGKHFWPGEIFDLSPLWINFFENHAAVQFTHRMLAVLTFCLVLLVAARGLSLEPPARLRRSFIALLLMACLQAGLGITTLLTQVNIVAATLHQAGALFLLAILMLLLHDLPGKDKPDAR